MELVYKRSPLVPCPSWMNSVYIITLIYLISTLVLFFHILLFIQSGLLPSGFITNILYAFSSLPCSAGEDEVFIAKFEAVVFWIVTPFSDVI
jgi:hypothetical protein